MDFASLWFGDGREEEDVRVNASDVNGKCLRRWEGGDI